MTTTQDLANAVQGLASDLQDLSRAARAARGIKPLESQAYCNVCDEPLVGVQSKAGLCLRCKVRRESKDYSEGA